MAGRIRQRGRAKPGLGARPGRRERHRAETRERLFRAALRLFADRGLTATTVEDITDAADVGKGTFFNYFPSKEHVLAAFGEMQVGKVAAAIGDARASGRPVREALRRMAHAVAEEPGRSPALVRALLTANLSSAAVRQLILQHLVRGWGLLGELFAEAQKRGAVRRDVKPLALARATQQMFFGVLMLWALDPSEKLKNRVDAAFELFWAGIRGKE